MEDPTNPDGQHTDGQPPMPAPRPRGASLWVPPAAPADPEAPPRPRPPGPFDRGVPPMPVGAIVDGPFARPAGGLAPSPAVASTPVGAAPVVEAQPPPPPPPPSGVDGRLAPPPPNGVEGLLAPPPPGVEGRLAPPPNGVEGRLAPPPGVVGQASPPPSATASTTAPVTTDPPGYPPSEPLTVLPPVMAPKPPLPSPPLDVRRSAGRDRAAGGWPPLRIAAVALAVLAVVALAGMANWGRYNQSSAEKWRAQGQADRARLEKQVAALTQSQADLATVRKRLGDSVAENATLTDRNLILEQVIKGAPNLVASMQACSAAASAVVGGDQGSVDRANAACATAQAEAAALQQVVDSLGL